MWEKIKKLLGFADLNKDGKLTIEDMEFAKAVAETEYKKTTEVVTEVVVAADKIKKVVKRGRKPK
jgi:hypothetical protein